MTKIMFSDLQFSAHLDMKSAMVISVIALSRNLSPGMRLVVAAK